MKKRYILTSLLLLASFAAYAIARGFTINNASESSALRMHTNIEPGTNQKTYQYYIQDLQELEQNAWKILNANGVTKDACMTIKQKHYKNYLQELSALKNECACANQYISESTRALFAAVLNDFGIDANSITLVARESISPAAATDTFFFVNEEMLNNYSPLAQKFIIGHELQHLIHKDHSTKFALIKIEVDVSPLAYNTLEHFFETRADTLTALKNEAYAQGKIEFMKRNLELYGDNKGITHPKTSLRLARAQEIVAMNLRNGQTTAIA